MTKRRATGNVNSPNEFIEVSILPEIAGKLYLNEDTADVHLVAKNSSGLMERIPAHKNLLSAASDDFYQSFYGTSKNKCDITMVHASAAAVREFLQFVYFNKVKLTLENIVDVMRLSQKYRIDECLAACNAFLRRVVTVANVCLVYQAAISLNQPELMEKCGTVISEQTKEVLASDGFAACDKAVLRRILDIDELWCREKDVFEACMSWVKKASKRTKVTKQLVQKHLGELLYQIRFRSVDFKELSSILPVYPDLFSDDEYNDIFQLIHNANHQPTLFTANRREQETKYQWNNNAKIACYRFNGYLNSPHYIKNIESTTLRTNEPLLCGGMFFFLKINGKFLENHRVKVTVTRKPNGNGQSRTLYHGELDTFDGSVKFPKPLLVGHEVQVKLNMPEGMEYHTIWQLETEVQLQSNIVVRFSKID